MVAVPEVVAMELKVLQDPEVLEELLVVVQPILLELLAVMAVAETVAWAVLVLVLLAETVGDLKVLQEPHMVVAVLEVVILMVETVHLVPYLSLLLVKVHHLLHLQ